MRMVLQAERTEGRVGPAQRPFVGSLPNCEHVIGLLEDAGIPQDPVVREMSLREVAERKLELAMQDLKETSIHLDSQVKAYEDLQFQYSVVERHLLEIHDTHAKLNEEIYEKQQRIEILVDEINEKENLLRVLMEELREREGSIRSYDETVNALLSSSSWRITLPLRKAALLLRRMISRGT